MLTEYRAALAALKAAEIELEAAKNYFNFAEPKEVGEAIYRLTSAEYKITAARLKVGRIVREIKRDYGR